MNPVLKKACRDRGISQNPRSWQENQQEGEKCPNCLSSVFSYQPQTAKWHCFSCNNDFVRDGWKLIMSDVQERSK